jgi:hypothetical protein
VSADDVGQSPTDRIHRTDRVAGVGGVEVDFDAVAVASGGFDDRVE